MKALIESKIAININRIFDSLNASMNINNENIKTHILFSNFIKNIKDIILKDTFKVLKINSMNIEEICNHYNFTSIDNIMVDFMIKLLILGNIMITVNMMYLNTLNNNKLINKDFILENLDGESMLFIFKVLIGSFKDFNQILEEIKHNISNFESEYYLEYEKNLEQFMVAITRSPDDNYSSIVREYLLNEFELLQKDNKSLCEWTLLEMNKYRDITGTMEKDRKLLNKMQLNNNILMEHIKNSLI